MRNNLIRPILTGLSCAVLIVPLAVWAQAPMPRQQMQGSVAWLNGGAGDEEVQFIKQEMKNYTLALSFASGTSPRADYVASAAVTVKDAGGTTVFEAPSVGPYLLLKLPPGTYSVTAIYHDQSQTRPVTASRSASTPVTFVWK